MKHLLRMDCASDQKPSKHFTIIRFGDNTLLAGSLVTAMFSSVGVTEYVWPEACLVQKDFLAFSVFLSPAFLALSTMELCKRGRNWKRLLALVFSAMATAMLGLAFHEALSQDPFFGHP